MSQNSQMVVSNAAYTVFSLGVIYVVVTSIGLFKLPSSDHPIADPYYAIMEVLSMMIPLLMSITLTTLHANVPKSSKVFSFISTMLMWITTTITSAVHATVLAMRTGLSMEELNKLDYLFSFKWPSVAYALDILAWDWFFALSMLAAALALKPLPGTRAVQVLMVTSGILSLIGLIGVPLGNMQVRNIGIIGYALVAPIAFLLLARKLAKE